jgi:molybdopterin-guanine dinucleotide biosynthesis protein A
MTAPGPDRATPDGIVLAGGPGRRMGHPKATVRLGDLTLVEHAVDLLRPRCARVVVVTREEIALPPLAVDVIVDRPGPDCPLVALATGLAATGTRDVLVLACDLPFAAPLLDALLDAPPGRAVVGRSGGHIQPLCARYPRAEALRAADDLLAAGRLPARGPALALEAHSVDDRWGALVNLNTPADLAHAAARAARAVKAG